MKRNRIYVHIYCTYEKQKYRKKKKMKTKQKTDSRR